MKRKALLLVIVLAAVGAGSAHAGVVVAKERGTLLVAAADGTVHAVRGHAAIGARLVGGRVVGHARRARLHGVVVRRAGTTAFIAANRHLLAVRSTDPTPAAPGSVVDTTVTVQPNGDLEDEDEQATGQAGASLQISATVAAVGAGTVTLSVDGRTVTLDLPNGLTLPATVVGQTVTFAVSLRGGDDEEEGGDDHGGQGHDGGGDD